VFYIEKSLKLSTPEDSSSLTSIYTKVYPISQLKCIIDGEELSWREVKKQLNNNKYNEIKIFSISNKLYKEIINYLNEEGIKYTIYGRSRIVLN